MGLPLSPRAAFIQPRPAPAHLIQILLALALLTLATYRVPAATNIVRANGPSSFVFVPSVLTITVGDTVLWTNSSSTTHDVNEGTFAGGLTPSPYWAPISLALLGKSMVTFSNIGSYPYVCNQHVFITPQPPGNPTQTGLVNVAAFNFPPTVNLTSPSAGTKLLAPAAVTLSAVAADQDGSVTNVQLFVGSNLVAQGKSPLSATVTNLPGGNYALTAKAVDNLGSTNISAAVNVVVSHRVDYFSTNYSPNVLRIKPGESIVFTNLDGEHTVTGSGSEPFCGSFLANVPVCEATLSAAGTFPYRCLFHSTSQASGMTGTVTVATFNRSPSVDLISPAPNAVLSAPATVALQANALDPDGSVSTVQFFNGATLLNSDTSFPFAFTVANLGPGSYTFTARTGDNLGLRATSAPVNITVVSAVQLTVPAMVGGGFQFNYSAVPGLRYVVEGSATQVGPAPYVPLATNVAASALESFIDPAPLALSNRMYRVFQQP